MPNPTEPGDLNPDAIRTFRQAQGLSLAQMARLLGYQGNNLRSIGFQLESGAMRCREPQRRLLAAYQAGYRPDDWPSE